PRGLHALLAEFPSAPLAALGLSGSCSSPRSQQVQPMTGLPPSRRDFLKAVGLCAAALVLPHCGRTPLKPATHPHFIVIMADDLSASELGCYGHKTHYTPVLDHLAQTGVQFRTCWATPLCRASRAELLTGRYGFRTGWYDNLLLGAPLLRPTNLCQRS